MRYARSSETNAMNTKLSRNLQNAERIELGSEVWGSGVRRSENINTFERTPTDLHMWAGCCCVIVWPWSPTYLNFPIIYGHSTQFSF